MAWLPPEEHREWTQDEMVRRYRDRLEGKIREAAKRLRGAARQGSLEDVRRADERLVTLEDIKRDFEEQEQ